MYFLGLDIGTSAIKAALIEAESFNLVAQASYPETEAAIISKHPGWAEQPPDDWWNSVVQACSELSAKHRAEMQAVKAIGISYQMHGLVILDAQMQVLRNSIIWCDSRAIAQGETAQNKIGSEKCLQRLLNYPGNFTGSKLAWVRQNEPDIFERVKYAMLPGDFIAYKLTGALTTTPAALSEGVLWDFISNQLSQDALNGQGLSAAIFPDVQPVFSVHGRVNADAAEALGISVDAVVSYKAGDQPNNALSLHVLKPGEVAATAGTSGVIYGVSEFAKPDPLARVNSFVHVNHQREAPRLGVLLCINGCGIMNSKAKQWFAPTMSYKNIDEEVANVAVGSEGLINLPFGNGAERMLGNRTVGAHFNGIDLNLHTPMHYLRAVQEGIAFSMAYGLEILKEVEVNAASIKAGNANMFKSKVFMQTLVNATGVPIELFETDGARGAAFGAAVGAGFAALDTAWMEKKTTIEPSRQLQFQTQEVFQGWKNALQRQLQDQ